MSGESRKEKIYNVIHRWSNETAHDGLDGHWYGYEALMDESGAEPLKECRRLVKELTTEKSIKREPTYDNDGRINGSGYFVR